MNRLRYWYFGILVVFFCILQSGIVYYKIDLTNKELIQAHLIYFVPTTLFFIISTIIKNMFLKNTSSR